MSYYNAICIRCPGKVWIVPGTEKDDTPRHTGTGYEFDGSAEREGLRLDAIHTAEPVNYHDERAQKWMLASALQLIHDLVPDAVFADFETSDQDRYGFTLRALRATADGPNLLPNWNDTDHELSGVTEDVFDLISDLNWNGIMGEGYGGYVTWNVVTNEVVESS